MTDLIKQLDSLNRKERFFLIGDVLGNQKFKLSRRFSTRLGAVLDTAVPTDSWVAMDYHLDWLYAAVHLLHCECSDPGVHDNGQHGVQGNQEDLDLIAAFPDGSRTRLIMIEAKAYGGWSKPQLDSKIRRLRTIFPEDAASWASGVDPSFVLMSPDEPTKLSTEGWPSWALKEGESVWLELPLPSGKSRVTRCDEADQESARGNHWALIPIDRPHYVYVVELSDDAGERTDPRKPCVYVGQSTHPPEVRFQLHRDGYKSSKYVRNFGVKLKPRLYRNHGPYQTRREALEAEARLANSLRDRGYTVFGGH